jgi:hypothetical protein
MLPFLTPPPPPPPPIPPIMICVFYRHPTNKETKKETKLQSTKKKADKTEKE